MRYALVAALVLAAVWACGGSFTSGGGGLDTPDLDGGHNSAPPGIDAGRDAGADAGDAGDAGTVACAATGFANPQVLDGCDNSGILQSATIQFNKNLCTVIIQWGNTASPCSGNITGNNDAFDGGCSGLGLLGCTATSLPGTIVCPNSTGTCNIRVCSLDAGGCN
jgi:hypothetical protein